MVDKLLTFGDERGIRMFLNGYYGQIADDILLDYWPHVGCGTIETVERFLFVIRCPIDCAELRLLRVSAAHDHLFT